MTPTTERSSPEPPADPVAVAERAPLVLFEQNHDERFVFVGAKIRDWTGLPAEAWISSKYRLEDVLSPSDCLSIPDHAEPSPSISGFDVRSFNFRHTLTGQIHSIIEIRRALHDRDGNPGGYAGVWWNLGLETRQKNRLQISHDSETIRQIFKGVVHDLNNVFIGISSFTELALGEAAAAHPLHDYLTHIKNNSSRAIELVQRVAPLTIPQTFRLDYHDLRVIVTEATGILRPAIPHHIKLKMNAGPVPLPLCADATSLQQAVFALVLNAADAMTKSGSIEVETFRLERMPEDLPVTGRRPSGPVACLCIKDSGSGFIAGNPVEYLRHHRSTKRGKAGLGVGLARVCEIATSLGGGLSVSSDGRSGTVVQCWLPLSDLSGKDWESKETPSGPQRLLLAVQSQAETSRWKPRLLEAGVDDVIPTKNPLLVLSENLESYDGVAFPEPASSGKNEWASIIAQIKAQKHGIRIIRLTEATDEVSEDSGCSFQADLILSSGSPSGQWREELQCLRTRPPF